MPQPLKVAPNQIPQQNCKAPQFGYVPQLNINIVTFTPKEIPAQSVIVLIVPYVHNVEDVPIETLHMIGHIAPSNGVQAYFG